MGLGAKNPLTTVVAGPSWRVGLLGERSQQALQRVQPKPTDLAEFSAIGGLDDRAIRSIRKVGASARAILGNQGKVAEGAQDVVGIHVPKPNDRTPGVSTIQPLPIRYEIVDDEVCRPRPVTVLTTPTARLAAGTSALTSVDLPTPE